MTIYRYGPIAWFWRVLCFAAVAVAILLIVLSVRTGSWLFALMAAIIAIPATVLPWMVATNIERITKDEITVTNLFFNRRRVSLSALGRPRFKRTAQGAITHIEAPRAWVPVAGGWPIYLDLYADIPDKDAFAAVFPSLAGKGSARKQSGDAT